MSSEMHAIEISNISKAFPVYAKPHHRLLQMLSRRNKQRWYQEFVALHDVSFNVERGETLGIVGRNGSGKSTLLQIICGTQTPTTGQVNVNGRVAALLELGSGFNPEFTGRENVFLNGMVLGLSWEEIEQRFESIAAFAEIGDFMERPVRTYSSGMYVRLAFSTAIHVDPEILVVDEALAVGDAIFANRCIKKFEELKQRKVTVLFVSHDLGLVKRLSDRAALMVDGRVAAYGAPSEVVNRYVGMVLERQDAPRTGGEGIGGSYRHGDGASRILSVEMLPSQSIAPGEPLTIRVRTRAEKDLENPVIGILIRNRLGIDVFGTNTRVERVDLGHMRAGEIFEVEFGFDCLLTRQDYTLTVASQYADGYSQDWLDDVIAFSVVDARDVAGLASFRTRVDWRRITE